MTTDQLLVDRAFGFLQAEDYVDWAVEQLSSGADSPSLRILAGLIPRFDREEVEAYFEKTCSELGITWIPLDHVPREAAHAVRALHEKGALSPEGVVRRMASLAIENWEDTLLKPWFYLAEDLDLRGSEYAGCFYPIESIENLGRTVDQEWEIFERLLHESDLEEIWNWVRCQNCGTNGPPTYKRRSLGWRISAKLRGGQPDAKWAHCASCGSAEVVAVGYDPDFRLARLREQG